MYRFWVLRSIYPSTGCNRVSRSVCVGLVLCSFATLSRSQTFTPKQREQAQAMLQGVSNDVRMYYYDPYLHGLDWDAKVREANEKIDKADSLNRALSVIASMLGDLNDSHTAFLTPPRPYVHDYGFQMQIIGDRCYVVHVRPGSDAESKGLKPGDEILAVNGYTPTREDFWRMKFLFWVLRPQESLRLKLLGVELGERQVDVVAKFRQLSRVKDLDELTAFDIDREQNEQMRYSGAHYAHRDYDLVIVKLPAFMAFPGMVEDIISKLQGYKAVIFDLRGDQGGSMEMLRSLLGGLFEHKVKIGDQVGRGKTKPMETEHHFYRFPGKVAVLVDAQSASASEIFARVIQLEKRGLVVGDRTSGMVMEAQRFVHRTAGTTEDSFLLYGTEVTVADVLMSDGLSLEHRGVVPDKLVLPTTADLASGRDPALAMAAELLNVEMSPEEAGKLFPYQWPPN